MSAGVFFTVVALAAGLSIALGVALPALGQARAAGRAVEAIARQPDESTTITRNLFIGLAMIESQALYVLIVALVLLFANPLVERLGTARAGGEGAVWLLAGSAVAAALAVTVGTMLSSWGQGRVTAAAVESIAEQPAARDAISTVMFISLALLESLALYALIVGLILLFANPLLGPALAPSG